MSEAAERARSHLSIGEVLNLLQGEFPDITISKIRFLESQGLLDPERTPSGYRKFYDADIGRLRWILHQQREHFLPLKVIKERLESGELDDPPATDAAGTETAVTQTTSDPGELDLRPTPAPAPAPRPEPEPTAAERAARDAARARASDPTSVALSREELADAAGITTAQLADLERFGLIAGRTIGPTVLYDEAALEVAKLSAGFLRHGVEGRHLRMYRVAAEREASFFEQVVMPQLKQRHPAARQQAIDTLGELAELGEGLRAAMLHQALRDYLGSG